MLSDTQRDSRMLAASKKRIRRTVANLASARRTARPSRLRIVLAIALGFAACRPISLRAQSPDPTALDPSALDPSALLPPPTDTWPTYNGDYSGRRYSTLDQINSSNINSLTLAWIYRTRGA